MTQPIVLPWRNPLEGANAFIYHVLAERMRADRQAKLLQDKFLGEREQTEFEREIKYQEEGRPQLNPTGGIPEGSITLPTQGKVFGPKPQEWVDLKPMKLGENILYGQKNTKTGETKYYTARPGKMAETNVSVMVEGKQPLTKASQNVAQKEVMNMQDMLGRTNTLIDQFNRDYLTYGGKLRAYTSKEAEKLGLRLSKKDSEFLGKRRVFIQGVERMFNVYRQEITGAAASVAELDRLKQSMLNADMSPTEFEAAAKSYLSELQRGIRLRNKFLREGIDVSDETGGKLYDRQFMTGMDDNIDVRGAELEQQGLSEQEIIEQLRSEGYL